MIISLIMNFNLEKYCLQVFFKYCGFNKKKSIDKSQQNKYIFELNNNIIFANEIKHNFLFSFYLHFSDSFR